MATILFWNVCKKRLHSQIATLCREHEVDILILAEVDFAEEPFLRMLNKGYSEKYLRPLNNSAYLKFFTRYPSDSFQSVSDEGRVAARLVRPPIGADFNLIAVHLPSKMHASEYDQAAASRSLSRVVTEAEDRSKHQRTLVIGDFNMNPFDDGVVAGDALHGIMDKRIALKLGRGVQGKQWQFMYNPMFSLMGDLSVGPSGTYYYETPGHLRFYWNTFDQVLVRPSLADTFGKEDIVVLTTCGGQSLLDAQGVPDKNRVSDHLPILFKFNIEDYVP